VNGESAERPGAVGVPSVVAVTVVHATGPWFDETLESLARQDYPALSCVFLVADGADDDTVERIEAVLPDAFVEPIGANPGFGPAANAVTQVVEGENGFFCFCHDDVALDSDAIRVMVEELYRSNACRTSASMSTASASPRAASSWARSTKSSTTPSAMCSPCRRPACSCAPTCSALSAGSTRR
jgi:GT2 family glycosyltransferase